MLRMKLVEIYMPMGMIERLKAEAGAAGLSLSAFIRKTLDNALAIAEHTRRNSGQGRARP